MAVLSFPVPGISCLLASSMKKYAYSYCKYTNEASYKTAEAIGMHFEKEYPDEANKITHVSVIRRDAVC